MLYVLDTSSSYFVLVLMLKFACQKDCWHGTAWPAALEHFGSLAALSWSRSAPAPPCSAAWIPSPPWYTMGSRGTSCFTVLLTMGPGGLLLWHLEHLSPSFSTELGICKAVSHSSLSFPAAVPQQLFCFSFLQPALPEAQTTALLGPALASSKAFP